MQPKRLAVGLLILATVFVLLHAYFPQNIVLFNISIPAGIILAIMGVMVLTFNKEITKRDVINVLQIIVHGFNYFSTQSKKQIKFLESSLQMGEWAPEEDTKSRTFKVLSTMGINNPKVEDLKKVLLDHNLRRQLAAQLGIYQETIDSIHLKRAADEKQVLEYLVNNALENRAFKKRYLVATTIVIPLVFLFGAMVYLDRQEMKDIVNYHLQERLATLIENRRLDVEDFDDINSFLETSKDKPLYTELREAREILSTIFENRESLEEGWKKAFQEYITNPSDPLTTGNIQANIFHRIYTPVANLFHGGFQIDIHKQKAYLDILRGYICAKYTSFGTYDTSAISMCRAFYRRALDFYPESEVALTGLAVSYKYSLQHMESNLDSTLVYTWLVSTHLDSAGSVPSSSFYQRARIYNNIADLYMEIGNRLINSPQWLIESGQYSRPCSRFWDQIKAISRSSVAPIFDTATVFLDNAQLLYPTGLPEIVFTRAQLNCLTAKYLISKSDTVGAQSKLDIANHMLEVAFSRGFSDPSVLFQDYRPMHYLDVYDQPWAKEYLDELREITTTYFPEADKKI